MFFYYTWWNKYISYMNNWSALCLYMHVSLNAIQLSPPINNDFVFSDYSYFQDRFLLDKNNRYLAHINQSPLIIVPCLRTIKSHCWLSVPVKLRIRIPHHWCTCLKKKHTLFYLIVARFRDCSCNTNCNYLLLWGQLTNRIVGVYDRILFHYSVNPFSHTVSPQL